MLLPTHVPRWLDAERPVVEPLTVVRGTIARHSTLASALEGLLSPAGVHRLVEAARPVYDLARLSVGRPFGLALGPAGLAVRNYWRSRHFAWDDVERLETGFRVPALRAPPALAVFPKRGRPFVVQASIRPSYRENKALLAVVRDHAGAHDVPVVPAPPAPDHGWLGGVRRRRAEARTPGRRLPL